MARRSLMGGLVIALWLALTSGLTGHAAPATPAPTNPLRVAQQRVLQLPRGDRILAFSPDGQAFAVLTGKALCVLSVTTLAEQTCAPLSHQGLSSVNQAGVRWSPDSRRLAFSEEAYRYGTDGDIWVLEVTTGRLTDLTDDGFAGPLFGGSTATPPTVPIDTSPAWSPDGQTLYFARSPRGNGEFQGTRIERIPARGGQAELVATVTLHEPGVIYFGGLLPAADGTTLYFTIGHTDQHDPSNGVWRIDGDGGHARQLATTTDPTRGFPILVAIAATGTWGLTSDSGAGQFGLRSSPYQLLNLATGTTQPLLPNGTPPTAGGFVVTATFSPDGRQLLYAWTEHGSATHQRLIVRDLATGGEQELSGEGTYARPLNLDGSGGLTWATNETVLGATSPFAAVQLHLSPTGGQITIGVNRTRDATGPWAVLTVADAGVGIPPADLPHIFERFHRGANVRRQIAGQGVGLAAVAQIVAEHGGTMTATSTEGQGTTVTVRLPLRPPGEQP